MLIYIPTRSRWDKLTTWSNLTPALQAKTTMVADADQIIPLEVQQRFAAAKTKVVIAQPKQKGIAAKRQWIMENALSSHLVMLDDDLVFNAKTPERKIVKASEAQTDAMFAQLAAWLDEGIVHCGITPRFLNWQDTAPWRECTRLLHVLAYNRKRVREAGCSFLKEDIPPTFSMDDFNMTLQLLRAGYTNRLALSYCTSPGPSNSVGGISEWRTLETHNASAELLAKLHAPYVRLRKKAAWQGMAGEMLDVSVQWRQALDSATQKSLFAL